MKNKIGILVASSAVLGSLLISGVAFAQTSQGGWNGRMGHMPGVFGTVSAINGSTLTINSKGFGSKVSATTYTVDATSATVTKNNATSSLSDIDVGDMVSVQGTVSGTNVTATSIHDGMMGRMGMKPGSHASSTAPIIQGNGQPVIGGNVTANNGSILTISNKSNVTYTVDATSATITKGGQASTLSNVSVGDNVVIQGAVNGTSVSASSVIDSGAPQASTGANTVSNAHRGGFGGFLGGIGSFFHNLFGFF